MPLDSITYANSDAMAPMFAMIAAPHCTDCTGDLHPVLYGVVKTGPHNSVTVSPFTRFPIRRDAPRLVPEGSRPASQLTFGRPLPGRSESYRHYGRAHSL